jgi:hypothetical protein
MNYQFTLKTEDGKHVVAKVYKPLPHTNEPPQVTSVSYQWSGLIRHINVLKYINLKEHQ